MAETNGTPQKFEIVEHEGKQVRRYPDGTLRGEHGHIVGQSRERAIQLRQRRNEQGTEVARRAIRKYTGSETTAEGIEKLVGKRIEVAMTDSGRAGNDAARQVLMMAGAYQPANQTVSVSGAVQHVPVSPLPDEFWEYLDRRVAEKREAIEVEAHDVKDE